MSKWESELGLEYGLEDWERNWLNLRQCTVSLSFRETALKFFTRWYYTPQRIQQIFPQASPHCFRGCLTSGSFFHIFWDCEHVSSVWKKVFELIDKLGGSQTDLSYRQCLLFEKIPDTPRPLRRLIHTLCTAVLWVVAFNWKSPIVPFTQVLSRMDLIMLSEQIFHKLHDTVPIYEAKWNPWWLFRIQSQC